MLVIYTKSKYQYLYIQKITHVFSNIHRSKHFMLVICTLTRSHMHIKMRTRNHQNQEWALASRLSSPSKPNTETSIYRRLTFREWLRAWEWENENDSARVIVRTRAWVRERNDSESESENSVIVSPQRVCESESEIEKKDSARGRWVSERERERQRWVRVRDGLEWAREGKETNLI